ncbi:MAG: hypothetical protein LBM96_00630 [Methanobrevibacter sp.]|jgi:hypothetical protein|nr:hypothetical protein [Candidatus Methanoflexus mossambicus]
MPSLFFLEFEFYLGVVATLIGVVAVLFAVYKKYTTQIANKLAGKVDFDKLNDDSQLKEGWKMINDLHTESCEFGSIKLKLDEIIDVIKENTDNIENLKHVVNKSIADRLKKEIEDMMDADADVFDVIDKFNEYKATNEPNGLEKAFNAYVKLKTAKHLNR